VEAGRFEVSQSLLADAFTNIIQALLGGAVGDGKHSSVHKLADVVQELCCGSLGESRFFLHSMSSPRARSYSGVIPSPRNRM